MNTDLELARPSILNSRNIPEIRRRFGEFVYSIITGIRINRLSTSEKNKQIADYISDFDKTLKILLNDENVAGNDEKFYHEIIHKSLELLLTKLKMDYVGIWIVSEQDFHPLHQTGLNKTLERSIIFGQIVEAEKACRNNLKNFCLFPVESKKGGVDCILIFKNLKGNTLGYLLLDDINDRRELTNFEIEKICSIYYSKLDKIIIEYELTKANLQNNFIKSELEQVIRMSRLDHLTGLINRKTGMETFAQRLSDVARGNSEVSVAMLDVDNFKKVNDEHGHLVGDEVLRRVAEVLNVGYSKDGKILHVRRSTDDFMRYGGEEIVLLLNHTNLNNAMIYLTKMKNLIESLRFKGKGGMEFGVTVSIGVTFITKEDVDFKDESPTENKIKKIIERADMAMYAAKKAGRNCIRFQL